MITFGNESGLHELCGTFTQRNQVFSEFTSPEACAEQIERDGQRKLWDRLGWETRLQNWYGTNTMEEAISLARDGWSEGAEIAQRALDKIKPNVPTKKKLAKYNVAGGLVDVPRFLAGDIKCMRQFAERRTSHRPAITFVSRSSTIAATNVQAMILRAAVCAALVDATEEQGYSCEVIVYTPTALGSTLASLAIRVKEAGSALDLARFAFGVGHPSVFRRFGFHHFAAHGESREISGCMGFPREAKMKLARGAYDLISFETGLRERDFYSIEQAIDSGLPKLIEALRDQGCPAFEDQDGAQ